MDKKKVLVIGSGAISGLVAKALGEMAHFDIEKIDVASSPFRSFVGSQPDLIVCDDHGGLLAMDFKTLEDRVYGMMAPDVRASNRLFAKGYNPSLMIYDDLLNMDTKPADHPTRKREPKGPRGKWGKLK